MLAQMPMMPPAGNPNRVQKKPFVAPGIMPPTPRPGFSSSATGAGGSTMPIPTPMRGMASGAQDMASPSTMPMTPPQNTMALNTGTNHGNARYGTDNVQTGGTRPPVGGTNPAWGPQSGVSPFDVQSGATGIGDFQRFSDNAYNEQVRRLDPQFAEQTRGFEQDMVNRGIAPGTPAYDNARRNFEQARSDAYAGARSQADQLGLAAQNQSFNQGATSSGLLNQLLLGQMGADASRFGATTSANASMRNAQTAAQTAANQLRQQGQQYDFGNLLSLLNFGQGTQGFNNGVAGQNNSANSQWLGQNTGLLGLFQPGQSGGNIDVMSPYNNQYNAGLNQAQFNQQQQNANNQMYAQMFASLYCDRNAKDELSKACADGALAAISSLPLALWSYKDDPEQVPHLGTYAQDFNAAAGLPANLYINPIDLFGALIGSVQALAARVKELEAA